MDLVPAMKGLSERQRLYVQARLEGNMPVESARRAGLEVPEVNWRSMEIAAPVRLALLKGREISIAATGVTRERITEMFEEAYRCATTAAEMVQAARELAKLAATLRIPLAQFREHFEYLAGFEPPGLAMDAQGEQ